MRAVWILLLLAIQAQAQLTTMDITVGKTTSVPIVVSPLPPTASSLTLALTYAPDGVSIPGNATLPTHPEGCFAATGPLSTARKGTVKVAIACSANLPPSLLITVPVVGLVRGQSLLTVYECSIGSLTQPTITCPTRAVLLRVR